MWIDCDVIQADGGTRCAAICGGYVAIASAFRRLVGNGSLPRTPLSDAVAAISVGIVDGEVLLDLPYAEDSRAEVDMNVVMTGSGELIEVQATAEKSPFGRASLDRMLELAAGGHRRDRARAGAGAHRAGVRIVLASANAHKARELGRLLEGWEVETYAGGLPEETGETFIENARLKARHVHAALGGSAWVLADDSGIEAAALGGVPGVRSARYAGEDATDEQNLAKLIAALADERRSPGALRGRAGRDRARTGPR